MGAIIEQQGLDVSVDTLNQAWLDACGEFRNTRSDPFSPFSPTPPPGGRLCRSIPRPRLPATGCRCRLLDQQHGTAGPLPETREALEAVSQKYRVVVLSNADDWLLDPVLERLDFPFAATMSSEGGRTYKPNPELFHTLLKQLDVASEEAVYVGDRQLEDVKGARLAGLGTVWINRTGTNADPNLPAPDHCITSLLDLVTLFDD